MPRKTPEKLDNPADESGETPQQREMSDALKNMAKQEIGKPELSGKEAERMQNKIELDKHWMEWLLESAKDGTDKAEWEKVIQELQATVKEMSDNGLVYSNEDISVESGHDQEALNKEALKIRDKYRKAQEKFVKLFDSARFYEKHPSYENKNREIVDAFGAGDVVVVGKLPEYAHPKGRSGTNERLIRGPIAEEMGITKVEPWLYREDGQPSGRTIREQDSQNIIYQLTPNGERAIRELSDMPKNPLKSLTKRELKRMGEEARDAESIRRKNFSAFTDKFRLSENE
ncbi:MAG: hypothetical protein NTW11_00600 [Candidatus Staskawiczbacteria bacterium]|nr:hypothetical protein [Candidatus Staskawiczbacteria bacterium]